MSHQGTLGGLTDEVLDRLHGYAGGQDRVTTLVNPMSATDLALKVDTTASVRVSGLIEVGSELVHVTSTDDSGNGTIPPWGRAQRGTERLVHGAGEKVTVAPRFPRSRVHVTLNDVLAGLHPDVYEVSQTTLNTSTVVQGYALPARCFSVISVATETLGPSGAWLPVRRYRLDRNADKTDYPTGVSLTLGQTPPGRRVKVTYAARLGTFTGDEAENISSVGLAASARDLLVLGAAASLLTGLEARRLQDGAVENRTQLESIPPGSASAAARQLMQMFMLRKDEERNRLLREYPRRIHFDT